MANKKTNKRTDIIDWNNLSWYVNCEELFTHDNAIEFSKKLKLCGVTKWRLPRVYELQNLHKESPTFIEKIKMCGYWAEGKDSIYNDYGLSYTFRPRTDGIKQCAVSVCSWGTLPAIFVSDQNAVCHTCKRAF